MLINNIFTSIMILICLMVCSCNRIKNKGKEIAEQVETKVKNESNDLLDKLFPAFDAYESDTKYNKERFFEYLSVELTPDVKDIYCYGDFIGVDYKVLFTFICDATTIHRILSAI